MLEVSMRNFKLAIVASFALFAAIFCLYDAGSAPVRGARLGSGIAAPTGLLASDGDYSTKVGLHWDTIWGANSYRVFRNTVNSPATASDLGTTVKNYFFDTTAAQGQSYFYWIRAEN